MDLFNYYPLTLEDIKYLIFLYFRSAVEAKRGFDSFCLQNAKTKVGNGNVS